MGIIEINRCVCREKKTDVIIFPSKLSLRNYSKKINKKDRKDKSVCVHESQSNPSIKRYIKR